PEVPADAALGVLGDGPVVVLADRADPHLQDVLVVGPEVGEPLAVGGDLRGGPVRVAEEDVAGDERGQRGPRLWCGGRGEQAGEESVAGHAGSSGDGDRKPTGD